MGGVAKSFIEQASSTNRSVPQRDGLVPTRTGWRIWTSGAEGVDAGTLEQRQEMIFMSERTTASDGVLQSLAPKGMSLSVLVLLLSASSGLYVLVLLTSTTVLVRAQ